MLPFTNIGLYKEADTIHLAFVRYIVTYKFLLQKNAAHERTIINKQNVFILPNQLDRILEYTLTTSKHTFQQTLVMC